MTRAAIEQIVATLAQKECGDECLWVPCPFCAKMNKFGMAVAEAIMATSASQIKSKPQSEDQPSLF